MVKNCIFYGDETGTDNTSRICAIGGLIGTESMWRKFDDKWNKILSIEGIPYFHTVDCERGKDDFYGLDVMKRGRIVDRLVCIIADSPLAIYGYAVVKPHFFAWNEDDRKHFTNGHPENPYYLVLNHLFVCSSHYADSFDKSERIEYLFEQQQQFEADARRIFGELRAGPLWKNHFRLGEIDFRGDIAKYPGMQAADLIAYEMFRQMDNKHFQPNLRPEWKNRIAIKVLEPKLRRDFNFGYFDDDQFLEMTALKAGWNYDTQTPSEGWVWGNAIKAREAEKAPKNKQSGK